MEYSIYKTKAYKYLFLSLLITALSAYLFYHKHKLLGMILVLLSLIAWRAALFGGRGFGGGKYPGILSASSELTQTSVTGHL